VLAISQNALQLVEVSSGERAHTVHVADLPDNAASAVGSPWIGGRSAAGRIHGSAGQKVRLGRFARAVDAAIRPMASGTGIPLIIAATELTEHGENMTSGCVLGRDGGNLSDVARRATYEAISTLSVGMDHFGAGAIDETTGVIPFDEVDEMPGGRPAVANVRFAVWGVYFGATLKPTHQAVLFAPDDRD